MADYSDYELDLLANVEEHGWQFTFVFDPDGKQPDFGYSVGFTKSIHAPEFIIFGLPKELMHSMIWEMYRQVEKGLQPKDGLVVHDLLDDHVCILRKAQHKDLYSQYVGSSNWFWKENGNEGYPKVYQIVWPGVHQGLFPWEKTCVQDVIDAQPHLWLKA